MPTKSQLVALPDGGPTLRVSLVAPPSGPSSFKLAVLLHPWSFLGGRMNDYVLQLLSPLFLDAGYHVLTFNSRGVGGSSGWPSLTGLSEGQDLTQIVKWALTKAGGLPVTAVVVLGYSHGSLIASLHPSTVTTDSEPHTRIPVHRIILSYPLAYRGLLTLFHSSTYQTALSNLTSPSDESLSNRVLIVYGTRDQFTSHSTLKSWADSLVVEARATEQPAGNLTVFEVHNGDHFWGDDQAATDLSRCISEWLLSCHSQLL